MSTNFFSRALVLLSLVVGAACDGSQVEELSTVAATLFAGGDPAFGPTLGFEARGSECPNLQADDVEVTLNGAPLDKSGLGGTVLSGPLVYSCLPGQLNLPVPGPVPADRFVNDDQVTFTDGVAVATYSARGLTVQRGYLPIDEGGTTFGFDELVLTPGGTLRLLWNVDDEVVSTFGVTLFDASFNSLTLQRQAGDSNAAPVLTVPEGLAAGEYTLALSGQTVLDVTCSGFAACSGTMAGNQNVTVTVASAP